MAGMKQAINGSGLLVQAAPAPTDASHDQVSACFKIINLNARSILSNADAVEAVILEHEPDIMIITETWIHKDVKDSEVTLSGYVIVRNDRKTRGGGIAFPIKDCIIFSVLDDNLAIEMLWITTRPNNQAVHIGGLDRAPNSSLDTIKKLRFYGFKV